MYYILGEKIVEKWNIPYPPSELTCGSNCEYEPHTLRDRCKACPDFIPQTRIPKPHVSYDLNIYDLMDIIFQAGYKICIHKIEGEYDIELWADFSDTYDYNITCGSLISALIMCIIEIGPEGIDTEQVRNLVAFL